MANEGPIKVVERRARHIDDQDRCWIEWALSQAPSKRWRGFFGQSGGARGGTMDYALGRDPMPERQSITWTIPRSALADADRHVRSRVDAANALEDAAATKDDANQGQAGAVETAQADRLRDLQDELRKLPPLD
ncbi:MAG TPA: hypothetical protein VMW80_07545 [Candidatus Dormibacteraeota bacterium]|nr:hypothetical protein [Candidatus Dormibacteraeota bacterium]